MAKGNNGLLSKLVLIGMVSASVVGSGAVMARTLSEPGTLTAAQASTVDKIMSQVSFLRAYPNSPMAAKVAAELAALLQSLPASVQAQVAENIAATGGLPEQVASLVGLPSVATATIDQVAPATSIY